MLPGELTLTGLSQEKLGEVVMMTALFVLGSRGVADETLIRVLLSGSDTLYWVRVKGFEAAGGCS